MTKTCTAIAMWSSALVLSAGAQDWTKESKDRAKRAALHDGAQLVRGDTGKWSDDPVVQHAPPLDRKPPKMTLDAWADQLRKNKVELTDKDEHWLILRTDQLDDNDRIWIERIERRGPNITIVANLAKWQGKYFRNFTYHQLIAVKLGKLDPGKYEVKWVLQPLVFSKFDGDGKALDNNWPKDERPVEKKATEIRGAVNVGKQN